MATLVHSISFAQGAWSSDALRRWWSASDLNPLTHSSERLKEILRISATERSQSFSPERRVRLVNALIRQYRTSGLEVNESTFDLLLAPNTLVVTTAHQPNWLGGPAYWLHKLLSTMALAGDLAKLLPEFHWIPLYWMGSEDHDLAELGHCVVDGNRIHWEGEQGNLAFGRLEIPKALSPELMNCFKDAPYLEKVQSLLTASYRGGFTVAQATRRLAHGLLGEGGWMGEQTTMDRLSADWSDGKRGTGYPLVVLDGDDAELKEAFEPVLRDQIDSPGKLAKMVLQRQEELKVEFGIEVNLHVRDWPFFVLEGNERWKPEGRYTAEELCSISPENFSPGVALRPLFQEFTLPNVAFVGGGAEQLYWAALKPAFAQYGIPYPLTMLRPSQTWLTPEMSLKWSALGWEREDLGLNPDALEAKFWKIIYQNNPSIAPFWEVGEFEAWVTSGLEDLMEPIRALLLEVDPGLQGALGASKHKMMQEMERLQQLYRKALKRKFKSDYEMAQSLREKIWPAEVPMERMEGMWSALAYGGPNLLKVGMENLSPLQVEETSRSPWLRFIDLRS